MWPFHKHNWIAVGVEVYEKIQWNYELTRKVKLGSYTLIKFHCDTCSKNTVDAIRGVWTLDELNGRTSE